MIDEKLFRDPVHDLITFDRSSPEDRLILSAFDTAEVQRLRRIKQLGMAHMAYQGAEHSRFAHSIGVLHLVRRMLDRLERDQALDPLLRLAVMLAGMLHDLGHGPFSHVMEKFFREHHETWTERIILSPETDINAVLRGYSPELPGLVVTVLRGEASPGWVNALISSQMDADRFDYLLRDSHMTGVKYGIFDLERLLLLLRVSEDQTRVVVSPKGVLPVEKYLQSRYQMYRQVYFHKAVTAAEAMLMAVLRRARDLVGDGGLSNVFPDSPLWKLLHEQPLAVEEFLALDDSVLFSAMNDWSRAQQGDFILRDLSHRILNRRLFKSLEIQTDGEDDLLFNSRLVAAREYLEDKGLDQRYYLRFSRSADTPYKPYSSRGKSVIWIQDPTDASVLVDVKDVSPTIRAFTESPYTIVRAHFPDTTPDGTPMREQLTALLRG
jgi:hypothetical protein